MARKSSTKDFNDLTAGGQPTSPEAIQPSLFPGSETPKKQALPEVPLTNAQRQAKYREKRAIDYALNINLPREAAARLLYLRMAADASVEDAVSAAINTAFHNAITQKLERKGISKEDMPREIECEIDAVHSEMGIVMGWMRSIRANQDFLNYSVTAGRISEEELPDREEALIENKKGLLEQLSNLKTVAVPDGFKQKLLAPGRRKKQTI